MGLDTESVHLLCYGEKTLAGNELVEDPADIVGLRRIWNHFVAFVEPVSE